MTEAIRFKVLKIEKFPPPYHKISGNYLGKIWFNVFFARFAPKKGGEVFYFSGKARKIKHIPLFFASEASKKNLTK
jgi:hypothetical protein